MRVLALVGIVCFVVACVDAEFNTWSPVNTTGAIGGRTFHTATSVPVHLNITTTSTGSTATYNSTIVYVFGGVNDDTNTTLDDLWLFNAATLEWQYQDVGNNITSSPPARYAHGAAYVQVRGSPHIMIFGGTDGLEDLNDLWLFSLTTSTWEVTTTTLQPPPRYHHSTTVLFNGGVLVYGGLRNSSDILTDAWLYNADNNLWLSLSIAAGAAPSSRFGHTCVEVLTGCLMFGGTNGTHDFGDLWYFGYDPTSSVWEKIDSNDGSAPPARHFHSSLMMNEGLLVYGGKTSNGTIYGDVWLFMFDSLTWIEVNNGSFVPVQRYGHTATALRGVFGSLNVSDVAFVPDAYGLLLYGGTDDSIVFYDTWYYDFNSTVEVEPTETSDEDSDEDIIKEKVGPYLTGFAMIIAGVSSTLGLAVFYKKQSHK